MAVLTTRTRDQMWRLKVAVKFVFMLIAALRSGLVDVQRMSPQWERYMRHAHGECYDDWLDDKRTRRREYRKLGVEWPEADDGGPIQFKSVFD